MAVKVEYYRFLSNAIARLDDNSVEARYALYDHAKRMLLLQLMQTKPAHTLDEIRTEEALFLDAIERCELEHERTPQTPEEDLRLVDQEHAPSKVVRQTRGSYPRKLRREILSASIGGALIAGAGLYWFGAGDLKPSEAMKRDISWFDYPQPPQNTEAIIVDSESFGEPGEAQLALLYEEDTSDPAGKKFLGSAYWRTRVESSGQPSSARSILILDLEIPEKQLVLNMTMRPTTEEGATMSHLMEFKFKATGGGDLDMISDVLGIMMKKDEKSSGAQLAGQIMRVAPGHFFYGWSEANGDAQRNLQLFQERSWIDIAMVYKNGIRSILAVEKGAAGELVINHAIANWNRRG
jgi:hypothetical protein